MFDVVGLGCCCFDLLGVVPHLPGLDQEISMLETRQQGGGEVSTALVALARLGCSVSYLGKVGDDPIGNLIRNEFEQYGVDTSHLVVEAGAVSQASIVLVDQPTGNDPLSPVFPPLPSCDPLSCRRASSSKPSTCISTGFTGQPPWKLHSEPTGQG